MYISTRSIVVEDIEGLFGVEGADERRRGSRRKLQAARLAENACLPGCH